MFIDRAVIEVRSGKGGNGAVEFLHEKYVAKGGPAGGNGGKGGSIYFVADSTINTLFDFRHSKVFTAQDGEKGGIKNQHGKNADDIYVKVPVGTVIYEEKDNRLLADLNENGATVMVAKGGKGGRGNASFRSSTNRLPMRAENGDPGENKRLILELKLLADVGFVGLPSVGKSTLLSIISSAKPEIADYPFTTLAPNLGVVYIGGDSFVAADLPGLIEGASEGKGLGLAFLRHIERCRVLVHLIDMSDNGRDALDDYNTICKELALYNKNVESKPTIVVGTKMDDEGSKEKLSFFEKRTGIKVFPISALTDEGITELKYECIKMLKNTPKMPLYNVEETVDHKVYTLDDEPFFEVVKVDGHSWRIIGDKIIRMYKKINLSTDEGLMLLLNKLNELRVDDKITEMGAKNGDIVYLEDFEFEHLD